MKNNYYIAFVWIVMALGGVTFIEPAPMDIGLMILIIVGMSTNKLIFEEKVIPLFIIMLVFLASNIISFFEVDILSVALRYFTITLYLVISIVFYIGFIGKYKAIGVKALFTGYTFAATTSAILGILAYFSILPGSDTFIKFGRVAGLFKDPNVFGPFMIPIAILALSIIENKGIKTKWIIIFCVTSVAVLLSYSRAAWGSYVAAVAFYYGLKFLRKPNFKIIFKMVILIIIIGISLYYIVSIPSIQNMFEQRLAIQSYDIERFAKQAQAYDIIKFHPFGIGPGQTELSIDYATHNGYLRIWLENGHIGFISYLILMGASLIICIKKAIRTGNNIYYVAAASIVALIINGFVIDITHWRHLWFVLAIPWTDLYCDKNYFTTTHRYSP